MVDEKKKPVIAEWSTPDKVVELDVLEREIQSVYTADPASFFMVVAILNRVRESVSEFHKLFAERPELQTVFDKTILAMAKAKLIDVAADRIILLRKSAYLDLRGADFDFVPKLLATVASRVRANYINDPKEAFARGEDMAWRNLPDHPKVRQRLVQITNKFFAEIDKLQSEIDSDPDITGEKVRFCLIMNSALEQEDF